MEVATVEDQRDIEGHTGKDLPPFELRRVIRGAECDVMDRACPHVPVDELRLYANVNEPAGPQSIGNKAKSILLLRRVAKSHLLQNAGGLLKSGFAECNPMKSADHVFLRNATVARNLVIIGIIRGDQFHAHSIGVSKTDHRLPKPTT